MKKQLFAVAAIGIAVCCLGACEIPDADTPDVYDGLNAMLNANYSQIEITVSETFEEATSLTSEYLITYSDVQIKVEYSVEKFVEVSLDNPSTEVKTTLTGEAIIKDGTISFNGDNAGITADIAQIGLNFKKKYFENDALTDGSFHADVKNAAGFIGSPLTCSNMKVVAYFGDVFNSINLTYVSVSGNKVEFAYFFTV